MAYGSVYMNKSNINNQLLLYKKSFKVEDTEGVVRSRKSKDRQYNDKKEIKKTKGNNLHNATQKTKD